MMYDIRSIKFQHVGYALLTRTEDEDINPF